MTRLWLLLVCTVVPVAAATGQAPPTDAQPERLLKLAVYAASQPADQVPFPITARLVSDLEREIEKEGTGIRIVSVERRDAHVAIALAREDVSDEICAVRVLVMVGAEQRALVGRGKAQDSAAAVASIAKDVREWMVTRYNVIIAAGPVRTPDVTVLPPSGPTASPSPAIPTASTNPPASAGAVAAPSSASAPKMVILSVPDGRERHGDIAGGSGALIVSSLRDALLAQGVSPFASDHQSLADGTKEAQELHYDCVLRARIVEWEDNATQWSGKRDSVGLSLELYDLSGKLISSTTQREQGSWLAMTDATPDRLVPLVVRPAVMRLLGSVANAGIAGRPVPSGEMREAKAPKTSPITNADVLKLLSAGVGDEVIIAKIRISQPAFELGTDDLVELKKAGVSNAVLAAMLEATKK